MRRLVVLVALVIVAGCGSTAPDRPPSPSSSASPSPSPSPTVTPTAGGEAAPDAPRTLPDAVRLIKQAESGIAPPLDADRLSTADGTYCDLTGGPLADVQVPPMCQVDTGVDAQDYCAGAKTMIIGRIELDDGLLVPVCSTDTLASGKAEPTLRNGQVTAASPARPLQCVAISKGVVCVGVGIGFVMSSDGYRLLP